MLSATQAAGAQNTQLIITAVGGTTLFFLVVALIVVMAMRSGWLQDRSGGSGYGRDPYRGGQSGGGSGAYRQGSPGSQVRGLLGQNQWPAQEEEYHGGKNLEPGGFQVGKAKFPIGKLRNKLTVEVDPDKCARFGFCEHEAPDVFALQSDGRFGYQGAVPMEKMDRVVRAMEVCPRRAIYVKLPRNS